MSLTYFINDGYNWYPVLDLITSTMDQLGQPWAFAGDVASILYGYANQHPIQTKSDVSIELMIQMDHDHSKQRIEVITSLREVGFDIHPDTLTMDHTIGGSRGKIVFVDTLLTKKIDTFPVLDLQLVINNKENELTKLSWNPSLEQHVVANQLVELIEISTQLP